MGMKSPWLLAASSDTKLSLSSFCLEKVLGRGFYFLMKKILMTQHNILFRQKFGFTICSKR